MHNLLRGLGEAGLERRGGGEWAAHPEREAGRVMSGRWAQQWAATALTTGEDGSWVYGFEIGRHVRASGPGAGNCPTFSHAAMECPSAAPWRLRHPQTGGGGRGRLV